jgi:putative ABC transport system substrate-binding protein
VASVIQARTTLGARQRSTGNPGNVALARTKIGDARDGAIIFSDLIGRLDLIRVACDKCGRDGCYGLNRPWPAFPFRCWSQAAVPPAVLAAKSATSMIPIVFAMSGDAVKLGLAKSFNRPGANATGIDILATVLDPKRLSLLHDLVPNASTIGYLVDARFLPSTQQVRSGEAAARAMGIRIRVMRASNEQEIDAAYETLGKENIRALAVASSPYFDTQRSRLVRLAARNSIPAIYHFREYVAAGGLISYGVDIVDAYRQVALYAGQILKGAKPGDLPILQPEKFDLVLNLKTAKTLGLTIPSGILSIADDVIE